LQQEKNSRPITAAQETHSSKCGAARNNVFCNWLSKLLLEELTAFTAVAQADGETLTVYEADVDVIHTIAALQESPRLWRAQ
jgi:hypothetical protein